MRLRAASVGCEDDPARRIVVDLYVDLTLIVGLLVEEEPRDRGWRVRDLHPGGIGVILVEIVSNDLPAVEDISRYLFSQFPLSISTLFGSRWLHPRL